MSTLLGWILTWALCRNYTKNCKVIKHIITLGGRSFSCTKCDYNMKNSMMLWWEYWCIPIDTDELSLYVNYVYIIQVYIYEYTGSVTAHLYVVEIHTEHCTMWDKWSSGLCYLQN